MVEAIQLSHGIYRTGELVSDMPRTMGETDRRSSPSEHRLHPGREGAISAGGASNQCRGEVAHVKLPARDHF